MQELSVSEELVLLCINPENGNTIFSGVFEQIQYGLPAALLYDLVIKRRIYYHNGKIQAVNGKPVENELLKSILNTIHYSKGQQKIEFWIQQIACDIPNLVDRILTELEEKGVIQVEKKQFRFGVKKYYHIIEKDYYKMVVGNLYKILNNKLVPTDKELGLITLITTCALQRIFEAESPKNVFTTINEDDLSQWKNFHISKNLARDIPQFVRIPKTIPLSF